MTHRGNFLYCVCAWGNGLIELLFVAIVSTSMNQDLNFCSAAHQLSLWNLFSYSLNFLLLYSKGRGSSLAICSHKRCVKVMHSLKTTRTKEPIYRSACLFSGCLHVPNLSLLFQNSNICNSERFFYFFNSNMLCMFFYACFSSYVL